MDKTLKGFSKELNNFKNVTKHECVIQSKSNQCKQEVAYILEAVSLNFSANLL